jgi:hypothetical protein
MSFLTPLNKKNTDEDLKRINEKIEFMNIGGTRVVIIGAENSVEQCSYCAKINNIKKQKLKVCGKCGQVKYCNKECQRSDWKKHKLECGKINPNDNLTLNRNNRNAVQVQFE